MWRILSIPKFNIADTKDIVAEIQNCEPSCRWPFQPMNSERWGTYSIWPWSEDCSRIYCKDKLMRHWNERHIHFVKVYDWIIFAAMWDDLPRLPETKWYWKLICSKDDWKTRVTILNNDRANFTAMWKIWEYYYFWEDAWIKKPTSKVLKTKDLKTFVKVFQLPTKYAGNIVWWTLVDGKYYIWTFVDRKWMIPTLWSTTDWKKRVLEKDYGKVEKDWHWIYRLTVVSNALDIAYNIK